MYIILFFFLLPVYFGFFRGTMIFFRDRTETKWWELYKLIHSIPSKIKKSTEFIRLMIYNKFRKPKLVEGTRDGDDKAMAERLTHAKHTRSW